MSPSQIQHFTEAKCDLQESPLLECKGLKAGNLGLSFHVGQFISTVTVHQGQELLRPEEKRDKMVSNIAERSKET